MTLTKAQARSAIREAIDDPAGKRWSDAALDALTSRTLDMLWTDLLDVAPYIVSQLQTIPTSQLTAPGYIDLRLTTNGGQLAQRFYRVQRLVRNLQDYDSIGELTQKYRVVISNDLEITAPRLTYRVEGNQLWMHPLDMTQSVELRYSFLPVPYTSLTEGYEVPWAEGYDDAYIYAVGAKALTKGDEEDMRNLMTLAQDSMEKLKGAISRSQVGGSRMQAVDDGTSWGA